MRTSIFRRFFRFRITTLLLLIAFVAMPLALYLSNRDRYAFTGVWYYPTPDVQGSGYWETLTIQSSGAFAKLEKYRLLTETYHGTYSIADDGIVTFHVTSKQYDPHSIPPKVKTFAVDARFRCRAAVDSHGNLIIVHLDPVQGPGVRIGYPDDCILSWYCYTPVSHEEQDRAKMKRLDDAIQSTNEAK